MDMYTVENGALVEGILVSRIYSPRARGDVAGVLLGDDMIVLLDAGAPPKPVKTDDGEVLFSAAPWYPATEGLRGHTFLRFDEKPQGRAILVHVDTANLADDPQTARWLEPADGSKMHSLRGYFLDQVREPRSRGCFEWGCSRMGCEARLLKLYPGDTVRIVDSSGCLAVLSNQKGRPHLCSPDEVGSGFLEETARLSSTVEPVVPDAAVTRREVNAAYVAAGAKFLEAFKKKKS